MIPDRRAPRAGGALEPGRPRRRQPRRPGSWRLRLLGLLAGVAATLLGMALGGVRWNRTPSLPPGLYLVRPIGSIARGDIVLFCLDPASAAFESARRIVGHGACPGRLRPLGKRIAAIPGDEVRHGPDAVRIGGHALPMSVTARHDRAGRPLPHPPFGVHVLRPGEFWVHSARHPRSFDSRYYGPVHRSRMRARLRPLLIW